MGIKSSFLGIIVVWLLFTGCDYGQQKESVDIRKPGELVVTSNLLFPTSTPDRIILNLTENPAHSVAVNWRTDTTVTSSTVQVAESTHGPEFLNDVRDIQGRREVLVYRPKNDTVENKPIVYPQVAANYHSAIIDNLNPGAQYVYRVGSELEWSEWFQINMPDPEKKISLIYFGDAQNSVKSMWSRVIRQAYGSIPDVDFMLHAGDLINRFDRDLEWGEWFHAGSFIHAMIPSVMTPGNHEYRNVVLSPQWRKQFNLPENGPKGLEELCYQVNYPNLKVISLDGEQIDESPKYMLAQKNWLDSVLTNDSRQWTAITFHYPIFSTKPNRDMVEFRKEFKPIFDKHKVDIILQGHDHAYGRGMVSNVSTGKRVKDDTSGTVYVVSVSGPKMYDVSDDPWMDRRAASTQLFQIITIEGKRLSYGAYTATGTLYDAFDLIKSDNAPNKIVNKIPDFPERVSSN